MLSDSKEERGVDVILLIECMICCVLFTVFVMWAIYKDPISMIKSYPPAIIKRVEELPQYKDTIKRREKKHAYQKLMAVLVFVIVLAALAYISGCRTFGNTFWHVFILFFVVNVYDFLVLDWGHFCHSKRVRIPGTEDMIKEYQNPWFHFRGACKGTVLGLLIALMAGGWVHFIAK